MIQGPGPRNCSRGTVAKAAQIAGEEIRWMRHNSSAKERRADSIEPAVKGCIVLPGAAEIGVGAGGAFVKDYRLAGGKQRG